MVSEQACRWRRAVEVPGTAALNTRGFAQVTSVSCPSPGACTAYGTLATRTDPGKAVRGQPWQGTVSPVAVPAQQAAQEPGLARCQRPPAQLAVPVLVHPAEQVIAAHAPHQ